MRTHAEELKSCSVQLELCWMSLNMCYPQSKSTSVYIWWHDSLRKKSAGCHCVHNYHHDNPSGTHQKSTKRSTHLYFTKPSIRCFPAVTSYQSVMLSVTCIIQLQWTKHAIDSDGIKIFLSTQTTTCQQKSALPNGTGNIVKKSGNSKH